MIQTKEKARAAGQSGRADGRHGEAGSLGIVQQITGALQWFRPEPHLIAAALAGVAQ